MNARTVLLAILAFYVVCALAPFVRTHLAAADDALGPEAAQRGQELEMAAQSASADDTRH